MSNSKNRQKENYNKTSKPLKPLSLHNSVRIQYGLNLETWESGANSPK